MTWNPAQDGRPYRSRWRWPALHHLPQRRRRRPASRQITWSTTLECGGLPHHHELARRDFDHTGITSNCVELPQRHQSGGQAGQSHADHQCVRELPHDRHRHQDAELGALALRSHADDGDDLSDLPQRQREDQSPDSVSGQPTNHVPPIPSLIDCGVCHGNNPAAETWTVLAASIATLHTGLNGEQLSAVPRRRDFAGMPAPYIPDVDFRRVALQATPLAPAAHSHSGRHRLQRLPRRGLPGRRLRAGHGDERARSTPSSRRPAIPAMTPARASMWAAARRCSCGRPTTSRAPIRAWRTQRLFGCAMRRRTGTRTALPAGHMPNPANLGLLAVPRSAPPSDYTPATLAAHPILHTGIAGNCGLCHGNNVERPHLVQQFHAQGCIAHALAHSLFLRHRLQLLPFPATSRSAHSARRT